MKYFLILSFGLLFSCQQEVKRSVVGKDNLTEPISRKLDYKEVPETRLTLNSNPKSAMPEDNIAENLFGKFHCGRAYFYVIQNPQNEIFNARVNSITLYYLDSALCKTKYILQRDIVTELLNELGTFRISGHDFKNRDIIASGNIISRTTSGTTLNSTLDNYELKWAFGNKEIRYRVNIRSDTPFTYLEKEKNYEEKYSHVERYCI